MNETLDNLLQTAIQKDASDIHFNAFQDELKIALRCAHGIVELKDHYDISLLHYLKFIANLDLGSTLAQSGNFAYSFQGKTYFFRFAFLESNGIQTGVLRILNNHAKIEIDDLSMDKKQNMIFKRWCELRSGLIVLSGPTGSGKTTTAHALLERIAQNKRLKVITLEDPIEIQSENYLQLQINEKMHFDYEEGIKQLLRHDPDVIMIGEVRDEKTAKTLIRCTLSGHMVFTTIHAKSAKEALYRLLDFGIKEKDLSEVLSAVTNQRIFPKKNKKGRVCVYEILAREEIQRFFKEGELSENHEDIFRQIEKAVEANRIAKSWAKADLTL